MSQCQAQQCMDPNMYMAPTPMMSPVSNKGIGMAGLPNNSGDMSMMHQTMNGGGGDASSSLMVDPYTAAATTSQSVADLDGGEDEDEQNGSSNEPLACYVCRGRRMCFCYFLKVRYYKFPSFLDLVDHQYKKWRHQAAKTGRQQS